LLRREVPIETSHEKGTASTATGSATRRGDGTVKNQFLTYKAFRQLLVMKLTPTKPDGKVPLALAAAGGDATTM
jgi:hypothetical protein